MPGTPSCRHFQDTEARSCVSVHQYRRKAIGNDDFLVDSLGAKLSRFALCEVNRLKFRTHERLNCMPQSRYADPLVHNRALRDALRGRRERVIGQLTVLLSFCTALRFTSAMRHLLTLAWFKSGGFMRSVTTNDQHGLDRDRELHTFHSAARRVHESFNHRFHIPTKGLNL